VNRTTAEKILDEKLWEQRNRANQEDPTLVDPELTVSAKVLDQYTSQENLTALFHNKEQAASLAKLSAELLTTYPNYPYHQPAHGVDVMRSIRALTEVIPVDRMNSDQKDLLLVAAAAHDAGFEAGPPPDGYATKEHYAVSFLDEYYEPGSAEYEFMKSAIIGTIPGPKEQICRDSIQAKLLHHADLGYVWQSGGQDFLNYTMRFRVEECRELSWQEQFKELELIFLLNYQEYLKNDMGECGVAEEVIEQMVRQIDENRQFITNPELDEPSQEIFQDWPMAQEKQVPSPYHIGKTVLTSSGVSL
jgi:hypothetical protein